MASDQNDTQRNEHEMTELGSDQLESVTGGTRLSPAQQAALAAAAAVREAAQSAVQEAVKSATNAAVAAAVGRPK